jgi:hypothetical protein
MTNQTHAQNNTVTPTPAKNGDEQKNANTAPGMKPAPEASPKSSPAK